jgi:uncharacterized RDD family membrane protein YckC
VIEGDLIGRRVAAALIDGIVVFLLFVLIGLATGEAETSDSSASVELEGVETVVWGLLGFAYYFATEARWGRTLGKRLLGVRVARLDGTPADAGPVAIRTLLRIIDVLPFLYLIGFTVMLTAGKGRQRLGDLAAGTAVVRG